MLVAANFEARKLFLGLYDENMRGLRNDMPIERILDDTPGFEGSALEGWTVYILGPEDTERFVAHFGAKG